MRRYTHSILPVVLVACAATQSSPAPTLSSAPGAVGVSTTPPAASSTPVTAEPSVLTEEQKQRDAARVPLATAVTDAFPNSNGIFSTLVASWSPDGKRFVFGSQRDGTPQIYLGEASAPSAAPQALTIGPERALWARFTRDGKSILFLRDSKGNENFHIFRVALDGTGLTDLTPAEGIFPGEPVLPRAVPGSMLYVGLRATDGSSTLFAQGLSGGEPRAIFTNPRPGAVLDVTADGSHALFLDAASADELAVVEVDVASGKGRRLYPAEGKKVSVLTVSYSPDGKLAYITTDEGANSSVLIGIDVKTGREVGRYTHGSPAPMNAIVSPQGNRIAVHIDAGNHGEVRILDSKTLKVERTVQVPLGLIQIGSFRDDGKAFSLLISLPDVPPDVYEVDSATGSVQPLRQDRRRGLESLPPIVASIVETKAFDGLTIPINQYLPRGTAASKKLPTLAIFHGGLAYNYAVRWSNFTRFFSALGYAIIEPNVRGSAGFGRAYQLADNREKRADWLKDVETVNTWAKSQPWCDPDRVVVFGADYGGYTSLMALTRQPALWRAGVDLFGITDLKAFVRNTDPAAQGFFAAEFGDPDKEEELLEAWSPSRDMDKIVAPLFVYAGQNDARIPRSEPDAIVNALRQRKVPVEYMLAANEGHGIDRRENQIELMTRLARFLEDSMGPAAK